MMALQLWHYDNFDEQLGTIKGIKSCVYEFKVSESHDLEFVCESPVEKEDRILWQDRTGRWHEFIVEDAVESDDAGKPLYTVTCVDSIDELSGDYHVDERPSGSATALLAALLKDSRWEVGTVNVSGSGRCYWYHQSSMEALGELCELIGCEWSTTIEVIGDHVTARRLNLVPRLGADTGNRFTYRHNLLGVERSRGQNKILTRVYGYGKGEEVGVKSDGTPSYGRKISFGEVNGGIDYVESDEARLRWGRPDGKGGKAHVVGKVEFSDCEDKEELLRLTTEWAEAQYSPRLSYTAKVADLSRGGLDPTAVDEGDDVAIVDTLFDPPVRVRGRVMAGKLDLLASGKDGDSYTIGNIRDGLADSLVEQDRRIKGLSDRAGEWDAAVYQPSAWLDSLIGNLNRQFDAGGSYKFESFEAGTIYASVPLDANGKPTRTPATAFQLTGLGFRIADEVDEQGEFRWRTFGTGSGFTADYINAGVIRGGSNYWNLGTGDLLFKQGSISSTDGRVLVNMTTGELKALDSGGKGIHLVNGKLTIDASAVTINATALGDYLTSQFKQTNDSIETQVSDLREDLESKIEQTSGSIKLTVTDGKLGSSASIQLSAGGTTSTGTIDMTGVRNAFRDDKTEITISAGKVTFNSGTFVVNSTNFNVTSTGVITAKSGTIGGLTLNATALYATRTQLEGTTYGTYFGPSGVGVGDGATWLALSNGHLYGGRGSSITSGYFSANYYWIPTGIYGSRIGGRGCVSILTDGTFGVGRYTEKDEDAVVMVGQSGQRDYVAGLSVSYGTISGTQCVTSVSISHGSMMFSDGLMVST